MKISSLFDKKNTGTGSRKISGKYRQIQIYSTSHTYLSDEDFDKETMFNLDIREEYELSYMNINDSDSLYQHAGDTTYDYLEQYRRSSSYFKVPRDIVIKTIEITFPEMFENNSGTKDNSINESLCHFCGKMNDNGIKICWWCGNNPGN